MSEMLLAKRVMLEIVAIFERENFFPGFTVVTTVFDCILNHTCVFFSLFKNKIGSKIKLIYHDEYLIKLYSMFYNFDHIN